MPPGRAVAAGAGVGVISGVGVGVSRGVGMGVGVHSISMSGASAVFAGMQPGNSIKQAASTAAAAERLPTRRPVAVQPVTRGRQLPPRLTVLCTVDIFLQMLKKLCMA